MDSVVHFEIPADQPERAHKFYQEAFGWKISAIPGMGYALVQTTPTGEHGRPAQPGAINGGIAKRQSPILHPNVVVHVSNIDEGMKRVKAAGGRLVGDKQQVGDMGIAAYFQDTEGNTLCLWQPIMKK